MKTIGKYRIMGLLGRGGMGRVYKVAVPVIGKILALKRLAPHPHLIHTLGEPAIRRLFETEAVIMAGIRHPHVLSVLDYGEADGRPYYLMDYHVHNLGALIGEGPRTHAPSRPLPVEKAILYTRQILSGLARLHHCGIVHRDLKPFNVLFTDEEQVKIGDFGLSRLRGESMRIPRQIKVGSPFYAAPEQERDPDHAGPAADLFSAGVILHRMLTGNLPRRRPVPMAHFNETLDGPWDAFLTRSTHPDPKKRFQSALEMQEALDALSDKWERRKEKACRIPMEPPPSTSPTPGRPRRQPVKIDPSRARAAFGLDSRWRPRPFAEPDLTPLGDGAVLRDSRTGLLWQASGAPYPVTLPEAAAYIEALNSRRFAGIAAWRMPTIPELVSIMRRPPAMGQMCLAPAFDPRHKWLWSADRKSFTARWYASMDLGFVGCQDETAGLFVKACASPS